MRGYFDEDEPEPKRPRGDTELTLGAGALLGLAFALLLVCGLCFGVGYAVGHHTTTPSTAANGPTPTPDQEPLQGNGSIPKPSAADQTTPPTPQTEDPPTTPDANTNPTTAQPSSGASQQGPNGQSGSGQGTGTSSPAQPVRPALPAGGNTTPATQPAPNVRAALPPPTQLMVQIAAVANPEDANVLVAALRKRGYPVIATREPADGLIHVRIGPFSSRDEANRWRDKLLGDGYNAVVQP